MFRAAVSDIDASEGWVKCGHCRKVFDCRKNEIKPIDFIRKDEPGDDEPSEQTLEDVSAENAQDNDEEQAFVPQISLFDETEQLDKSNEQTANNPPAGKTTLPHDSISTDNKPVKIHKPLVQESELLANKSTPIHPEDNSAKISLRVEADTIRSSSMPETADNNDRPDARISDYKNQHTENKTKQPQQPQSTLKKRLNITKPQAPAFSAVILAKAQSWKKQRNRFKKTKAFPYALIAIALFALLIWQIAIVNYTKLSQYRFLSAPLMAVCSVVTCNQASAPQAAGFEILHASVRRHASMPNVMSISAKLINFSDENKLMPTLRLDLTNDNNAIIASRTIVLPENPQYVEPALSQLAPGQDVQLLFNIENPNLSAHGFQLSLVSVQE